jgi:dTMP kinase
MSNVANQRGALILLEGLDRSGKSTQCKLLNEYYNAKDCSGGSVLMRFPDRATGTGRMIDSYLKSENNLDDHAVHLLFAANRWEVKDKIIETLNKGIHIIVDRYSYSGVAFSTAKGLDFDWCFNAECGLPKPDIVFYLTLDTNTAANRGDYGAERYENESLQEKVKQQFELLRDNTWVNVDANNTIDKITQQLLLNANKTIENVKTSPIQYITKAVK